MKIEKVEINNFRKLNKNVIIDMDNELLIVGKNNTGKTSVFEVFEKFLSPRKSFKFEDFNYSSIGKTYINSIYCEYKETLKCNNNKKLNDEQINEVSKKFPQIKITIDLSIGKNDNLALIKDLIYEFENNENIQLIGKYEIFNIKYLIDEYENYNNKIKEKREITQDIRLEDLDFYSYFKRHYFSTYRINFYSTKKNGKYIKKVEEKFVKNLFNIGVITAQREVDDTSEQSRQNISNKIWEYYQRITKENKELHQEDTFKNSIDDIKGMLNNNYSAIFKTLIGEINTNILNNDKRQSVEIASDFDIEEMLKKNSKLQYSIDDLILPESYNGLGYSNMLYMFIQIITYKNEVMNQNKIFNILFIEEPESHLHPQMQSSFLEKIENILGKEENIYKIITTHSSYILQNSELLNIRYFLEEENNMVVKSLNKYLNKEENIGFKEFLKKYFRINTCDLFFADKAILVEGSVERMLMPIFIKKHDRDSLVTNKLSKQHITVLEVGGAYAHVFNKLLDFLDIKTLIITDIDSVSGQYNSKCECDLSNQTKEHLTIKTSNAVIKNWFDIENKPLYIKDIVEKPSINTLLIKKNSKDEEIRKISFQLPNNEEMKWGRTFEEQLIIENSSYFENILKNEDGTLKIESLKKAIKCTKEGNVCNIDSKDITSSILKEYAYFIVEEIEKTDLAFDLLTLDSWILPNYIEEGLKWLQK